MIYSSATATDPISLQRTRNPVYWKSACFPLRRLEDLAAARWSPQQEGASAPAATSRAGPSNADTLRHVGRLIDRVARRRLARATSQRQWFLGFRPRRDGDLPRENPARWQMALPPSDRYWAETRSSSRGTARRSCSLNSSARARPAGRPFLHAGVLIRPAQDCTTRYGARVVFNAVDVLTVDDYLERPVGVLGPEWAGPSALGAHTYTFAGGWEATDGLRRVPRWRS